MKTIVRSLLLLLLAFSLQTALSAQKTSDAQDAGENAKADAPAKSDAKDAKKDPMENMKFRNLGPAVGGGRITTVAGVAGKPNLYYVGAAGGGVFVTQDGGLSWKAIFEKESTASIGAIALAPSNPSIVWVGTGESNLRNDVISGKGVYSSPDGGATWNFMGLKDAGQISNIVIDPHDPNTVLVGVLGHAWGPNKERGVFRTKDGGKNWDKVLFVDDTTGVSSLIMEPGNPLVLFAGMWQVRRYPWMLESGGPNGGIYRSNDGGTSWKKLSEGLPEGAVGRIGLAAAQSNPRHIYAVVESKKGIAWDSLDLGDHWRQASDNHSFNARPFYFSQVAVAPNNENKVYFINYNIMLSEDGGKTGRNTTRGGVHVDHHALWIDPSDPERMIDGNDGGVYITSDGGRTWRYADNLPIEQFYSVAQDDEAPYNLCGGLQDNNGWCGTSNSLSRGGITGFDWFTVVGGDGEYVVPARGGHSHTVYADSQNGSIQKINIQNGLSGSIRPYLKGVQAVKPADLKYRFNWTSPIGVSYTNENEVYLGGNVLFKSTDGGAHWTPISPDLTRDDKTKQLSSGGSIELDLSGAETFDTILSFSISPIDPKIIWTGSDDGLVQVTRDGGQHWTNVTTNIPNLPAWGRIQQIEASPNNDGTAYVAVDFHEVDNNKPYAFKTHDYGKTWTPIMQGLPQDDPARVIREDPNHKGFLVLGTDAGLFYSIDDGAHWTALKSNFPTVPIYDIKFVKKSHDLVVATHGRGLFVLDDITPLEESGAELARNDFHLFSGLSATNWHMWNKRGFDADGFTAPNPMNGAVITYFVPTEIKTSPEQRKKGQTPVKITISDSTGTQLRTMYGTAHYGINRVSWNLRCDGPKKLNFLPGPNADQEEGEFFDPSSGPTVLPGTYKIAVTFNGKTETRTVDVGTDPRFNLDINALRAQFKLGMELRDEVSALDEALNRLNSLHKQISSLQEMLGTDEGQEGATNVSYKPVLEQVKALDKKLTTLQGPLYNSEVQPGSQDDIHYLQRFHSQLQGLMRGVMGSFGEAPSDLLVEEAATTRKELDEHLQKFNAFLNTEVAAFNKTAIDHGSSTLFAGGPVEVRPEGSASSGAGNEEDDDDPDGGN
ncbi:MAG TPA: hypothetical protein VKZ53_14820 [Candidatus Angelobacter sp.]|nr:hypothetical protein [Candidatus Angelobacter sp.]